MSDINVIRRVFTDEAGGQILVEAWLERGTVKIAQRKNQWETWGRPLTEILNQDEVTK